MSPAPTHQVSTDAPGTRFGYKKNAFELYIIPFLDNNNYPNRYGVAHFFFGLVKRQQAAIIKHLNDVGWFL